MLIHNQKEIVSDILENLKKKRLYNIPTGTGKTYILLSAAKEIRKKYGLKVIISTSTNQLVNEFFEVSQKHFGMKNEVKISIGKDNYIDYNEYKYFRQTKVLEEYITENSLIEYENFIKDKDKTQLFFYDFENIVELSDVANIKLIKELVSKKKSDENKFNGDISITNHFYLITSLRNAQNEFYDDHVLLTDETHLIGEVAKTVLSKNFSIFSAKLALYNLKKELDKMDDFVGKEALKKNINTISVSARKILDKYSQGSLIGINSDDKRKEQYLKKVESFYRSGTTNSLKKQLNKHSDKFSKNCSVFLKELQNIEGIISSYAVNPNYVSLSFTPSRGYPLLSSYSENPLGFLNKLLWNKLKYYAGVSATIAPSFNPSTKELNYAFRRLGMLGETRDIVFYPKIFPRELLEVHLPDSLAPNYKSVYEDDFDIKQSNYHNYIIKYIHSNHNNKNSIIFCGGYKEAEGFANLYSLMYGDTNVHYANKNKTSIQVLKEFTATGGLLFATRDYGTGITLKGELLENIFLLRLPYPITSDYYWQNLMKQNKNMFMTSLNFEMLISLMQFLGRLQRSATDSGAIHLLDNRYSKNIQLKAKIKNILEYYGITKEKDKNSIQSENMITKEKLKDVSILESLLT